MRATQLLKWAIAILLYRSRALGLFHRLRNRHTLTVVVFHRVLRRDDPRTRTAFAEWTMAQVGIKGPKNMDAFAWLNLVFARAFRKAGEPHVQDLDHALAIEQQKAVPASE